MDWLPQWAQITVSVAGAATIAGGFYWNLVRKVDGIKSDLDSHETAVATKHDELDREMTKLDETSNKLLDKAESRDQQLAEQGIQIAKIATQVELQLPMMMDSLKAINDKLDNTK